MSTTPSKLIRLAEKLFEWQSPSSFARIVAAISANRGAPPADGRPRHRLRQFKEWREAWVLKFLIGEVRPRRVRLLRQRSGEPDAEMELRDGSVEVVEITEAMAEEFNPATMGGQTREPVSDGPPEKWRKRVDSIPALLTGAAEKKRLKPYANGSTLLIYLNLGGTYGVAHDEAVQHIRSFASRYSPQFRSVRVVWDSTVF